MRKASLLILLLIAGLCVHAQQPTNAVSGTLSDTSSKQSLYKAVVSLLSAKDSMLVKFARTDMKGHFVIKDVPPGKYIVLTTFPNYADYTDTLTMGSATVDLGAISMITKAHLLEEVVVKQTIAAIKMKGDTLEFKADSFKLQANANVEELLKRLPGIQVDKNGAITAQGQKVQKVLVDGEEFFGDDPTLVTQNIRADMVDKVQVFDKTSEQADFTGVDDGERSKTINLKLKEDKKKGYFGKIDGGGGTDGYYNGQVMFNKFRKREKISAYGIASNTGKTGLNWSESEKFGDMSSNIEFDEDGDGMIFMNGGDESDWDGRYNGQGYPTVRTGGAHYNNKWGDVKSTNLNGNYKFLNLDVNGGNGTTTQYLLPDTMYFMSQRQVFNNNIIRHKGGAAYEINFDSTSSLKMMVDGSSDNKKTYNRYFSESRAEDSLLVNTSDRTMTNEALTQKFNSSFLWRKKLAKKGRTLSLNGKQNYSTSEGTGFLSADNQFYKGGALLRDSLTDQYRVSHTRLTAFDLRATYTEPLSAYTSLVFNYGITINNSANTRSSYNKSGGGKYDVIDTTYSNDYKFDYLMHKGGVNYTVTKKKYRFGIGNNVGFTSYTQTDLRNNIARNRDFVNWFPQASFRYSINNHSNFNVSYNGSTSQPSLQQLQPLRTNDDPNFITIGNPNLRPSFRNSMYISYGNWAALSGNSFNISLSYSNTNNAIASNDMVDTLSRRISQAINVDGNQNWSMWMNKGFKIWDAHTSIGIDYSGSRNSNMVNNVLNVTNSNNISFSAYAGKMIEKFYDNSIRASATYTTSTSSIQKNVKVNYWTYSIRPDLDFYLPWKMQIHTDVDFQFRQKTSAFTGNNNVIFMNAWFGKKLLPGDALVIKVSVNDLFNQNIGFNRNVNSNFISENTYSTIQRYFMLSAVWNFTKGLGAPKGDDD